VFVFSTDCFTVLLQLLVYWLIRISVKST